MKYADYGRLVSYLICFNTHPNWFSFIHEFNIFFPEIQYPCRRQGNPAFWRPETAHRYRPSSRTQAPDPASGWSYFCLRHRKWKGNLSLSQESNFFFFLYCDYWFYSHSLKLKTGNMVSCVNYVFWQIIDKYKCLPWGKKKDFLHLYGSRQIEVAMKNAFLSLEVFRLQLRKHCQNWIRTQKLQKPKMTEDAAREHWLGFFSVKLWNVAFLSLLPSPILWSLLHVHS